MPNWVPRNSISCLQLGDVVLTPSIIPGTGVVIPIVNHIAIILFVCKIPYLMHLPWGKTPVLESVEEFEKNRQIVRVLRNEQTKSITNEELINNYHEIAKKSYNFFNYNCEDFIRCITKGKVDVGFDQRCGYGCLLLIIIAIVLIYILAKRK